MIIGFVIEPLTPYANYNPITKINIGDTWVQTVDGVNKTYSATDQSISGDYWTNQIDNLHPEPFVEFLDEFVVNYTLTNNSIISVRRTSQIINPIYSYDAYGNFMVSMRSEPSVSNITVHLDGNLLLWADFNSSISVILSQFLTDIAITGRGAHRAFRIDYGLNSQFGDRFEPGISIGSTEEVYHSTVYTSREYLGDFQGFPTRMFNITFDYLSSNFDIGFILASQYSTSQMRGISSGNTHFGFLDDNFSVTQESVKRVTIQHGLFGYEIIGQEVDDAGNSFDILGISPNGYKKAVSVFSPEIGLPLHQMYYDNNSGIVTRVIISDLKSFNIEESNWPLADVSDLAIVTKFVTETITVGIGNATQGELSTSTVTPAGTEFAIETVTVELEPTSSGEVTTTTVTQTDALSFNGRIGIMLIPAIYWRTKRRRV